MSKMYKVLLVDDHDVVRMGLNALLEDSEFQVVGEAGTVKEAVEKTRQTHPDVVLMDVRLPDGSGIEACREIISQNSEVRVLMLTSFADEEAVLGSIEAGASGYVLKEIGRQALRDAIGKVVKGEALLDPMITMSVLNRVRARSGQIVEKQEPVLSKKEREILIEVAKGKSNKLIAQELFLSEYTVRNYVSSILEKLNLASRVQLANYVFEKGLNS